MDKDFYNESSASKLGWEPEWFGCDEFDDDLVAAIAKFQKDRKMAAETIPSFGILETFAQFSLSSGGGGHRRSFRRKSVDERDQF